MTKFGKVALVFVAGLHVSSPGMAASPLPIDVTVSAARELLDSWSGQPATLEQAQQDLARVLAANPQDYLALKEMARYQLMAGYINSHLVQFQTHYYSIGNYAPGTLKAAESLVRDALRINPRFAEGHVLLGHILFEQTRLDEAATSLTRAEALGTDDPWLQLNWAALNSARGEYSAARSRWQRVLRSPSVSPKARLVAYEFLIESHKRSGDHDKVVALYQEQIRLYPGNAWLRGGFAEFLTNTLGRNDEAIVQARLALKTMNYGIGQRILAMALYGKWAEIAMRGDDAESERYFREASSLYPQLGNVMVYGASVPAGGKLAKALAAKKGVSIDARVADGSTALLVATNRNRVQTVRMLLDLRANPNIADNAGWTPLLSAADEGNTEMVVLLLASGADIRATKRGMDAASLAQARGKTDLAALLSKRAADVK